jgi:hypothetical protein
MQVEGSIATFEFDRFDKADLVVCDFDLGTTGDRAWNELQSLVAETVTVHSPAALFGISVAFFSQIVPTLLICRLIKEALPGARIILGGPQITMWHDQLRRMRATQGYVDYLCTGQGEPTLAALAQLLLVQDGGSRHASPCHLAAVPNLVYKVGHDFVGPTAHRQTPLDELPPPDLNPLAKLRYFNNERQIPVTTCAPTGTVSFAIRPTTRPARRTSPTYAPTSWIDIQQTGSISSTRTRIYGWYYRPLICWLTAASGLSSAPAIGSSPCFSIATSAARCARLGAC